MLRNKHIEERYGDMTYKVVEYLTENDKEDLALMYMELLMASDEGVELLIDEVKTWIKQ